MPDLTAHAPRRLARNALLNFGGQALQLLAGIAVVPFLVRGLGADAFGAFQLVWVVLTYLALVDLGLGRATTRFVADALGRGAADDVPDVTATALTVQLALGVAGGLLIATLAPPLALALVAVPPDLQGPTATAFRLLAAALPAALLTASLSGVLEAHQRFDLVNAVRVPTGILTVVAPVGALALGAELVGVVVSVVLVRLLALPAYGLLCVAAVPSLRRPLGPRRDLLRRMLGFGGWLTVSNVVSPLMQYLDRYIVGTRLGLTPVAHYTAPFDAITRAALVPWSVASTLFPAVSALHAAGAHADARHLARRATLAVAALMAPLCLGAIVLAGPALRLWLGDAFAQAATTALQVLAAGVFVNALAQVPYTVLHGRGRADLVARFHLAELGPYLALAWVATGRWGITGTACAWTARAAADAALLFAAAARAPGRSAVP